MGSATIEDVHVSSVTATRGVLAGRRPLRRSCECKYIKLMNQKSAIDTSNFDEEFTSEVPQDSVVADSHLSQTVQQQL